MKEEDLKLAAHAFVAKTWPGARIYSTPSALYISLADICRAHRDKDLARTLLDLGRAAKSWNIAFERERTNNHQPAWCDDCISVRWEKASGPKPITCTVCGAPFTMDLSDPKQTCACRDPSKDEVYDFKSKTFPGWALIEAITEHQEIVGDRDNDKFFPTARAGVPIGDRQPTRVALRINGVEVPFEKTMMIVEEQVDLFIAKKAAELVEERLRDVVGKTQEVLHHLIKDIVDHTRQRLGLPPIEPDDGF